MTVWFNRLRSRDLRRDLGLASRILLQTAMVLRIIDDESEEEPEDREPIYYGKLKLKDKETGFVRLLRA